MIYLTSVKLKNSAEGKNYYPFNIPLISNLEEFKIETEVTFLVGENGTGKSTFLEAIAAGINHITIGESDIGKDKTLLSARELGDYLQFSWKIRTHKGFYLRAEDVFGFTKKISADKKELDEFVKEIDRSSSGYGNLLARGALLGQKSGFEAKYGKNLDANSHGETFLRIFQSRFVPGGLYLLDEPDTPLSFKRQLSLLYLIKEFVKQEAQFIVATHSPVLITLPGSTIFNIDDGTFRKVNYEDTDQFTLMKNFLNNPQVFLKHLETE